jgi:diguanylate cyclase (GGDEF)-like protein
MRTKEIGNEGFDTSRGDMGSGDGLGGPPDAAVLRDASADRRDLAAEERDVEASVRDGAALVADSGERPSSHLPAGRGWERRAARERQLSAGDRVDAAMDRRQAAADRSATRDQQAHDAIDPLTGALRRRPGLAALGRELERSERAGGDLIVAFVDTVGLEEINHSRGHAAGDRVLQDIAECLAGGQGDTDFVMRVGGGGFVCSMVGQTMGQADERYAKILVRLARRANGARMTVGLTARQAGDTVEILVDRADQVMMGRIFNGRLGSGTAPSSTAGARVAPTNQRRSDG